MENEASVFVERRTWIPELLLLLPHRAQWRLQVQLRGDQDHPEAPGSPNAAESRFPGTIQSPSGKKNCFFPRRKRISISKHSISALRGARRGARALPLIRRRVIVRNRPRGPLSQGGGGDLEGAIADRGGIFDDAAVQKRAEVAAQTASVAA